MKQLNINKPQRMTYFVDYNCKFIFSSKSLKRCLNHIERKGLQSDCDNMLRIVDQNGDEYNPMNGCPIEY